MTAAVVTGAVVLAGAAVLWLTVVVLVRKDRRMRARGRAEFLAVVGDDLDLQVLSEEIEYALWPGGVRGDRRA